MLPTARCVALFLAGLVLLAPRSAAGEKRLERVAAVLQRRASETRSREELVQELVRLGTELIPLWRGWLVGEDVDELFLGNGEFQAGAWAVEPEAAGELALATLSALPPEAVLAELEHGILRDGPGPNEYMATLRVLEALGSARGLSLYWQIVERLGPDVVELPRYRGAAEAALTSILARDRAVWTPLAQRLAKPEALEAELFLAAARAASRPEAHELVLSLLDGKQELDRSAGLATLARLERDHPWRFEPELVTRIAREWPGFEPESRVVALQLLGASEDPRAVAPLRAELGALDPLVAAAAARALAELAGVDFGRDEAAWERWEEREFQWWSERGEAALQGLDGVIEGVATTCAELAAHPLFRRELATRVGARVAQLEPSVQGLAASFLLGLRTRAALPGLVRLAQHADDAELRARIEGELLARGVSVRRATEAEAPSHEEP